MPVHRVVATFAAAGLAVVAMTTARPMMAAAAAPPAGAACAVNARKANLNFTLKDINGKAVRLSDYRGKVLLVDFWATWCGPCKIEIPAFIDLYNKYKAQGFEVVGVVVQDPFVKAKPFALQYQMNYPVLDGDGRDDLEDGFASLLGLPTSFLLARDGRMCKVHIGLPQTKSIGDAAQIKALFEAEIKALL
jgi:thiol-disulfide isomerase/thioredoxin